MTDIALVVIFWSGMCAVGVFAYHLGRARGQREGMGVNVTVSRSLLHEINSKIVNQWLDAHGLVWMPRGVDRALKSEKK